MRIGFRSRRRGMIDKIVTAKRALVARLLRSPAPFELHHPREGHVSRAARARAQRPRWVAEIRFRRLSPPSVFPLRKPELGAERESPDLCRELDAPTRAIAYAEAGCRFISLATDADFLGGRLGELPAVRSALEERFGEARPDLVADDFVLHPAQLRWLAGSGADAVVLRARLVDGPALAELVRTAGELGLGAWVEVDGEPALGSALDAGAPALLVTPEDLDTLRRDEARALALVRLAAGARSGSTSPLVVGRRLEPRDVTPEAAAHVDVGWTGDALMRERDPRRWLEALLSRS